MKQKLNKILSRLIGYQLSKANRDHVEELFVSKWFKTFNFNTVIDVGANNGQFARSVRIAMPEVKIISFEPIPEECSALKNSFKDDRNYVVHQLALGKEAGQTNFLVNDFSPTSSLLEQTDLQKEYYPVTGNSKKIEVNIERLDTVLSVDELTGGVLLKVDVQGFEDQVLIGAENILSKVDLIYVECSFKEFYKGQPLFHDIYELLHEKGFVFMGIGDQLKAGKKGEPTQIDAIFVNSKKIS
ncbi:MAG: FkbM family methyltransferase [Flavobacteriales bacterium]|nr:FkbM family methyltransferase [Flavobacteriales bacterium]